MSLDSSGDVMQVDVTARGDVPAGAQQAARDKVGALASLVEGALLGARVVLTQEANPRLATPARAEGAINIAGRPVRARVAGPTMSAAVDELTEQLHRRLRHYVERLQDATRRPPEPGDAEWFHGAWSAPRPEHFPRPPQEREIVRRKSFAVPAQTVVQAAEDMAALDHDFYLFSYGPPERDAVLYRRSEGGLAVIVAPGAPTPVGCDGITLETSRFSAPIDIETARAEMDQVDHRFLFFVNRDNGRGSVIYLRYDGHYGLIEPALS